MDKALEWNIQEDRDAVMILIVEDEAVSRWALEQLLRMSGYDAKSVSSAEEAKTVLAQGHSPRLALVDVELPGASGLDLVRWMERVKPSVVPMLMTASEDEGVNRFQETHPLSFFRKPLEFNSLLQVIKSLAIN